MPKNFPKKIKMINTKCAFPEITKLCAASYKFQKLHESYTNPLT